MNHPLGRARATTPLNLMKIEKLIIIQRPKISRTLQGSTNLDPMPLLNSHPGQDLGLKFYRRVSLVPRGYTEGQTIVRRSIWKATIRIIVNLTTLRS